MDPKLEAEEKILFKNNITQANLSKHKYPIFVTKKQDISCLDSSSDLAVNLNEDGSSASNPVSSFNPLMYSFVTFEGKLNFNYLQFCQDNKLIN